jgi:cyanophycinase-like exopeptidase
MTKDHAIKRPRGIGVDEKTSVCIDKDGEARVFGYGNAYFLEATGKPELMKEQTPLIWNRKSKAIKAYIYPASLQGTPAFNVNHWPKESPTEYWWVEGGVLRRSPAQSTGNE